MKQWRVSDVMTTAVASVPADAGYKDIADLLVARGISAVPVVDIDGCVLGVVSEADLLAKLSYPDRIATHPLVSRRRRAASRKVSGDTAAELMTAPAVTVRPTVSVARAARLMEAARVKRLPVVDEAGRLIGIVARRDLVRLYTRSDQAIRQSVQRDVLDALWVEPGTVEVSVSAGVVTLTGTVDRTSTAQIVVRFAQAVPGVVDVVDRLVGKVDDSHAPGAGWYRGHPFSAEPQDIVGGPR